MSGGKDSTRQAHWVRDRLGLNPLLICAAYPPLQMSQIGAKNLSNLLSMGFDLITLTPAPQTSAELSLKSFELFGNVCKSTEMSLFSSVPRLAIDIGVNMIFWGENPALQVGDSAALGVDPYDGNNLRKMNTLTDGGYEWIKSSVNKSYKTDHYVYPDEISFEKNKISIFYLLTHNFYLCGIEWFALTKNPLLDISNAMLDEEFTNINMMLKYYKFIWSATDLVSEMIRSRCLEVKGWRVTKYDGIMMIRLLKIL